MGFTKFEIKWSSIAALQSRVSVNLPIEHLFFPVLSVIHVLFTNLNPACTYNWHSERAALKHFLKASDFWVIESYFRKQVLEQETGSIHWSFMRCIRIVLCKEKVKSARLYHHFLLIAIIYDPSVLQLLTMVEKYVSCFLPFMTIHNLTYLLA